MNFWQEIYDAAKDRRYGLLFFGTLLAFFIVFLLGVFVASLTGANNFEECVYSGLAAVGVLILIVMWRLISQARRERRERLKSEKLSCDELSKARSKLRSRLRPPIKKLPDIDLKY